MFKDLTYKKPDGNISQIELEKLTSFFLYLIKNKHQVRIIFRGENYSNLKVKLNLNGDNDYNKLSSFLFLLGDKGRTYRNEFKKKILKKNKIYSLNCISDDLVKNIFKKLNYILTRKANNKEVQLFKTKNIEFCEYFLNTKNKEHLKDKIKSLENVDDKIKVRDYYLSLLHKIGKIGFYNNSFFISTTTDFNVAKKFSENTCSSTRLILFSWVSFPMNKIGVSFNYLNKSSNLIKSLGLPIYNRIFYQAQNEISIKGGLLPHYILGFLKLESKEFIVNPNFLNSNKDFIGMVKDGFNIDQTTFNEKLDETDYNGFFTINEDGLLEDIN